MLVIYRLQNSAFLGHRYFHKVEITAIILMLG